MGKRTMFASALAVAVATACSVEEVSEVDEASFSQELAGVECSFYFSCACEDYGYPDEAFCRESLEDLYAAYLEPARKAGLTFNSTCAQAELDYIASDVCIESYDGGDGDFDWTCEYCSLYHGDKAAGEACTNYAEFDDCANGLYCSEGKCVDPCPPLGQPCEPGSSSCADGLYCPLDGEAVCTKLPIAGEACDFVCAEGLSCGIEGVCAETPSLGDACDFECASGSMCSDDGVCIAPPKAGEPCASGRCEVGNYCDGSDAEVLTCRALKAAGDECQQHEQCSSGNCEGTCLEAQSWVCE